MVNVLNNAPIIIIIILFQISAKNVQVLVNNVEVLLLLIVLNARIYTFYQVILFRAHVHDAPQVAKYVLDSRIHVLSAHLI